MGTGGDPEWRRYLQAVRQAAPTADRGTVAAATVRALAEVLGWSMPTDLRIHEVADPSVVVPPPPAALADPWLPGRVLEAVSDAGRRRADGAHYTPAPIAGALVAATRHGAPDAVAAGDVCDPACGGGAFLLAAADALVADGQDPAVVATARLWGMDTDPVAVAVAEAALALWAWQNGDRSGGHPGAHLQVADGLAGRPPAWPPLDRGGFALVVGNPPFLGQLASDTARSAADHATARARFGAAAGPYTDAAALFVLAALDLAAPNGGRVALVLPSSLLSSRDGRAMRERALQQADLVGLWVAAEPVFAANVRVCAPVLEHRIAGRAAGSAPRSVARWRGRAFEPLIAAAPPGGPDDWPRLALAAHGVPELRPSTRGRLGDVATARPGFREHFYGLVPYVVEAPGADGPDELPPGLAALVTAGLVDVGSCAWGQRTARFGGRRWDRPAVDLVRLRAAGGRVARWVDDLLVPKLVLAPQTRVVEAAVDATGSWVGSVPTIAIVATADSSLRELAAVLNSPPIAAMALARSVGSALAEGAIKLSASQVADLPLPADHDAWREGASLLATGDLPAYGAAMARAYGLAADDPVVAWWDERRPATESAR